MYKEILPAWNQLNKLFDITGTTAMILLAWYTSSLVYCKVISTVIVCPTLKTYVYTNLMLSSSPKFVFGAPLTMPFLIKYV